MVLDIRRQACYGHLSHSLPFFDESFQSALWFSLLSLLLDNGFDLWILLRFDFELLQFVSSPPETRDVFYLMTKLGLLQEHVFDLEPIALVIERSVHWKILDASRELSRSSDTFQWHYHALISSHRYCLTRQQHGNKLSPCFTHAIACSQWARSSQTAAASMRQKRRLIFSLHAVFERLALVEFFFKYFAFASNAADIDFTSPDIRSDCVDGSFLKITEMSLTQWQWQLFRSLNFALDEDGQSGLVEKSTSN